MCRTCPFDRRNFGKPNPPGFTEAEAENTTGVRMDWYSADNARRMYNGGLDEHFLLCHSSDPDAATYGGARHTPGRERLCVGQLTAMMKHLKLIERFVNADPKRGFAAYKKHAGKNAIPKMQAIGLIMTIAMGRTHLLGGLPFPLNVESGTVQNVGVPWEDSIINEATTTD